MAPYPVTVYRDRTWHPTPSQYTDTGHDTPPRHSIQTQDMTPHLITVYRHRTRHSTPSQYTDTGHDTPPRHRIQTQDMTPHPVKVYRHRADLSLCYPLMWNVTLEYTITHFNAIGKFFPNLLYTPGNVKLSDAVMVVGCQKLGRFIC